MKRYDPRRADNRTLPEKLVGLIAAASEDEIAQTNETLARLNQGRKGARFDFQIPLRDSRRLAMPELE